MFGMGAAFFRQAATGGDPYFGNVVSLMHFDGASGSTTFTDQKGNTWSAVSGAKLDTASFKFGTASLVLNGSTDYITTPNFSGLDFGSGDFTIEAWINPNNVSNNEVIIANWYGGGNPANCAFIFYITSSGKLQLSYGVGSTNAGTPSTTGISASTWTHVAVCRQGTTVSYYINGVKDATTYTFSGSLNIAPGPAIAIGCASPSTGPSLFFNGHIDELRVTKGVARYSATFTPPAAPFPNF